MGLGRVGPKKFALFFPLPSSIVVLFLFLWVSSRGILVVFLKRWGPQMCLGVCCLGQMNPHCYLGQLLLRPMSLRPDLGAKTHNVTQANLSKPKFSWSGVGREEGRERKVRH